VQPGTCSFIASGAADARAACATQTAASCGTDGTCDGSGGCRKYPGGTLCKPGSCDAATNQRMVASTCDGNGACVASPGASCAPYRCNGPACFTGCGTNADCSPPNVCIGGSCGLQPAGAVCKAGTECATGTCTDGVCCQAMTCGACSACNVPGSLGACAPVADGAPDPRATCATQPATDCGYDGKCDGAGACRKYPPSTVCGQGQCTGDGISVVLAPHCDGKGVCDMGVMQSCAPYNCDAAAGACRTKCTGPGDCVAPNICNAKGMCGDLQPLGAACVDGGECQSGHCVDKVCCSASACGSCEACNVGNNTGSCAPVAAGDPDPAGTCLAAPASGCGDDGRCDGAGACRKYPAGTVCLAATCMGNTATPASTCNGTGTCVPPAGTIACGTYACNGGTCKTTCSVDDDCTAPNTCVGSTCRLKPAGGACTGDPQCETGHCTDGVCCQSGPCGSCRACNVPNFLGFCHAVGPGVMDPAGVCVVQPVAGCGTDGKCDGAGNCRLYPSGTVCNPGICQGRTFTRPDLCDGNGRCSDRGTRNCDPYICNPLAGACYNSCITNAQCSGNNKCIVGNCI
jgi:hypothetical protein